MNGHLLIKVTNMFYWIWSTGIKGENGLMKSPRKAHIFYISRERWLRNLTQRLVHDIVPQAFAGRALIPASTAILLVVGKSLTGRSSRSSSISSIICLFKGQLEIGLWISSPCAAQFFLQFINFTLHVSIIPCIGNMVLPSRLASTGMSCVRTSLMISPMLKVYKWIAMLRPS